MSNGDAKEIQMEAAEAEWAPKVSPRGPTGIPKGFRGGRKGVQNIYERSLQGTNGDPRGSQRESAGADGARKEYKANLRRLHGDAKGIQTHHTEDFQLPFEGPAAGLRFL